MAGDIALLVLALLGHSIALLHNPTGGNLQCQCTCSPVGVPDKTIYTSGNLNIIDKHVHSNPQTADKSVMVQQSIVGDNTEVMEEMQPATQFQDVAAPGMESAIETGMGENMEINNAAIQHTDLIKPQITWAHSARSGEEKAQIGTKEEVPVANSLTKGNELSVSKHSQLSNGGKVSLVPEQLKLPAINVVSEKQITQDTVGTISKPDQNSQAIAGTMETTTSGTPNQVMSVLSSQPKDIKNAAESINQESSMTYSSNQKEGDQVAADIGFVMDGGALNPILSGVVSGMGGKGSGFIVETIDKTPSRGTFVDNNESKPLVGSSMIANGGTPSISQSTNSNTGADMTVSKSTFSLSNGGGSNSVISKQENVVSNTQTISKASVLNSMGSPNNNKQDQANVATNTQISMANSGIIDQPGNNMQSNTNNNNQMTSNNNNQMTNNNNNQMVNNNNNQMTNNNNNQNGMGNNNNQNNSENKKRSTNNNNGQSQMATSNNNNNNNNNSNNRMANNNNNNRNSNQMSRNGNQQPFNQNNPRNNNNGNNNNANRNGNNNGWNRQQNGGNNQNNQQATQNKMRNNNNWNPNLFNEFNLKPFQVQRDQKPNNNQWGNTGSTWTPTTVIPYGMDPNMFFSLTI